MTPKQEAALRLAREALQYVYEGANNQGPHTGISWRCASNKVEPVIAAIDEALAEQQSGIKQVIDLYDSPEQPAQQDYWQEEARRYAQNAEFWRGKYEAATAQQQEPVATWENKYGMKEWQVHALRAGWSLPASKPWVGLSTDEMKEIADRYHLKPPNVPVAFRAIEAKLKDKNGY